MAFKGVLPPLLIRADATTDIGTGHMMRCLALGQAWLSNGGTVVFLGHCQSDLLRERIEHADIEFLSLDKPHPDPSDLKVTLAKLDELVIRQSQRPWLILDGYHFDTKYQQAVQAMGHRLMAIDDIAHLPYYSVDILLNQNINAEGLRYSCNPDTLLLLGTEYALLRSEFLAWQGWQRNVPDLARKVLITLGGSDPANVTFKVIRALQQINIDRLEAVVVIGASNPHYAVVQAASSGTSATIQLVLNASNMPELMAWADVTVSAGGSTSWEVAFMGLPSLILVLAENQRGVAEGLSKAGIGFELGWFEQITETNIAEALLSLLRDRRRRELMSHAGRILVDGLGCGRVVSALQHHEQSRVLGL